MAINLDDADFMNGAMLGAVRLRGQWRLFIGFVADWIMDYYAYDPAANPAHPDHQERLNHRREVMERSRNSPNWDPEDEDDDEFRDGLYQVDEANADAFCRAMERWEVMPNELQRWLPTLNEETSWRGKLVVVIDFDKKVFANGFDEMNIERYIPPRWKGVEDNPLKYVSPEIRSWWIAAGYVL